MIRRPSVGWLELRLSIPVVFWWFLMCSASHNLGTADPNPILTTDFSNKVVDDEQPLVSLGITNQQLPVIQHVDCLNEFPLT